MRAVADSGPPHYLVLSGYIRILPALFGEVAIPDAVRDWIGSTPAWLSVNPVTAEMLARTDAALDRGERAALALAMERRPDLVLMDDRAGVAAAHAHGFVVTGTLGVLVRAARRGLLELPAALDALARTSFHWTPGLRARVVAEYARDG